MKTFFVVCVIDGRICEIPVPLEGIENLRSAEAKEIVKERLYESWQNIDEFTGSSPVRDVA